MYLSKYHEIVSMFPNMITKTYSKRLFKPETRFTAVTLMLTWMSSHIPRKACDEITYPFPNFNSSIVKVSDG